MQKRICQNSGFLSVLNDVNSQIWETDFLKSLNITNEHIESSYFMHELFPNSDMLKQLHEQMEWFWAGFETVESFTEQLHQIIFESRA